jgi:acetoin utilization protein AcuB
MAGRVPVWPRAIPVRERMRSPVATIRADAPIRNAVELMRLREIRHLPVVDADGRLVGIATDRDLRQAVFAPAVQERLDVGAVQDIAIREVMTWAVITVGPAADIREAARLMHEQKIGALPVAQDGRLVGILTESDVLGAFEEVLRSQVTTVSPLRAGPSAEPYDYGFAEPRGGESEAETGTPGNPA